MAQENPAANLNSLGLNHADINTIVIIDEPEENTVVYAWKGKGFKKLPYDEHIAKTGQKIRTFMTFNKSERVTVVTINKEIMCITLTVGLVENKQLRQIGNPIKYFGSKNIAEISLKYTHKGPIDNPVLFFSLDPDSFGEEIRGSIVESGDENAHGGRQLVRVINDYGAVGIAQDAREKPNFYAQKITPVE